MANGTQVIAAALEELLTAFGRGIGQAQLELGRSSIQLQREIDADPELSQHGVQATWYQIPSAEMEFKVALSISSPGGASAPQAAARPVARALVVHPLNATYQNQFRFEASAASTMRVTVLPVPPQTSATVDQPPRLTSTEVMKLANPLLVRDTAGAVRSDTRIVANFQVASRVWYVLQYTQEGGATNTVAVIEVDDATRQARKR